MRVVIYARVSTREQDNDNQLRPLKAFAASRAWDIAGIYQEKESAWREGQQQQLEALRSAARQRKFDIVLIWALDRLTRQGPAAVLNLVAEFKNYGVKVISYQESWTEQVDSATLPLFLSIAGWLAQQESARRSARILAGFARVKENGRTKSGRPVGRPPGRKDSEGVKRKRSRYIARWEDQREVNKLASKITSEGAAVSVSAPAE
jgi:putative DNA-invertase from lambdoid prophage Rac